MFRIGKRLDSIRQHAKAVCACANVFQYLRRLFHMVGPASTFFTDFNTGPHLCMVGAVPLILCGIGEFSKFKQHRRDPIPTLIGSVLLRSGFALDSSDEDAGLRNQKTA